MLNPPAIKAKPLYLPRKAGRALSHNGREGCGKYYFGELCAGFIFSVEREMAILYSSR